MPANDAERPAFTLIDDREGREHHTRFSEGVQERLESIYIHSEEKGGAPILLRVLSFALAVFGTVFASLALAWSLFMTLLAAIELFRNSAQNTIMRKGWLFFSTVVAAVISALVAIIYPRWGVGLFVAYYSYSRRFV